MTVTPREFFGTVASIVALLLMIAVNIWWGPNAGYSGAATLQVWGITLALTVGFILLVGYGINGRPAGLIIDNRNRVSLSKFQAICWTVLVLSAFGTVAAARMRAGVPDPLAVDIPPELLAAMGISAGSLIATPALLSLKTTSDASAEQIASAAAGTGTPQDEATAAGRVFGRTTPDAAQWLDMFRGDEVSNADAPDLSKIQQFLITVLILGIYGGEIAHLLLSSGAAVVTNGKVTTAATGFLLGKDASMPLLSQHLIWLMGISHASYLAYKAMPHGSSQPSADQDAVG